MDKEITLISQDEPVAGPSHVAHNKEANTKRKRSHSCSSSSSSDSTSSSSSSSSDHRSKHKSARRRRHKKRGRKHRRRHPERKVKQTGDLPNQYLNNSVPVPDDVISLFAEDDFEQEASSFLNNLGVETKLKEPAIPKTDARYVNILKEIQFFNKPDWSEVRYAETQKSYNHSPGFVELEANEEIRPYDTLKHLSYSERAYASLTYGLLKQKESLKKELCSFMTWVRDQKEEISFEAINQKLNDIFTSGEFSKVSADLLQMVCGHRAETIQMRRDSITNAVRDPLVKSSIRKIPPSEVNLFNSEQFVVALDKVGGIKKAFWPASKSTSSSKSTYSPASTSQVGKWLIRPSQGQHSVPPSQGKNYNTNMPSHGCQNCDVPSHGDFFQHNMQGPSQGPARTYYNYPQQGNGTVDRGSFRSRGARQNQRYHAHRRGSHKRRSSPSGFNAKRNKY